VVFAARVGKAGGLGRAGQKQRAPVPGQQDGSPPEAPCDVLGALSREEGLLAAVRVSMAGIVGTSLLVPGIPDTVILAKTGRQGSVDGMDS